MVRWENSVGLLLKILFTYHLTSYSTTWYQLMHDTWPAYNDIWHMVVRLALVNHLILHNGLADLSAASFLNDNHCQIGPSATHDDCYCCFFFYFVKTHCFSSALQVDCFFFLLLQLIALAMYFCCGTQPYRLFVVFSFPQVYCFFFFFLLQCMAAALSFPFVFCASWLFFEFLYHLAVAQVNCCFSFSIILIQEQWWQFIVFLFSRLFYLALATAQVNCWFWEAVWGEGQLDDGISISEKSVKLSIAMMWSTAAQVNCCFSFYFILILWFIVSLFYFVPPHRLLVGYCFSLHCHHWEKPSGQLIF